MRGVSFKDLLKENIDPDLIARIPRSFDIIGNIAIIKLDPDLIDLGPLIAKAIMRIHKNIRSVYARSKIQGVERISTLIHLGGVDNCETIYKENGVRFNVNLRYMYVNTRLSTERAAIAEIIRDGERILDMFSSYGPFSITIASRRRVEVLASDINCRALSYMARSIKLNKLLGKIYMICTDSRYLNEFIKVKFTTVIMDNPTNIDPFLSKVKDMIYPGGRIIVYILDNSLNNAIKRILNVLGNEFRYVGYREVKEYSAKSSIYRIIFIRY